MRTATILTTALPLGIAWHRRAFRLFWTWKSRHRIGRPAVPHDVRALIREMSTTNPLRGAAHNDATGLATHCTQVESRTVLLCGRHSRLRACVRVSPAV